MSPCLSVRRFPRFTVLPFHRFSVSPFHGGFILDTFDAIIIGSGQAGNPLAVKFAASGKKVALVEKEHIGGSCVNVGCSPTKTMEASGRVAHIVNRAAGYGITFNGPVTVDMETVRRRKRDIVTSFSSGDEAKLIRKGVEILWGEARFTSGKEVEVAINSGGTRLLKADLIFIDTGTRPVVPEIVGLPECSILNNGTIMELGQVPEHLIIIGGGYVGMEFARMFNRFGSQVTVVHRGAHVLSREDEDLAEAIQEIYTRDGIRIILQADTHSASQDKNGNIHLRLTCLEGEETISGTHLLLAAGRIPNTDMLNLPAAGVKTDEGGYILTDDHLRTSAQGIYALGDVKGGPAFTHIAYDDYRIVKSNLFEKSNVSVTNRAVPYVVFIDPQLGRIGLSEKEATRQGIPYKMVKMPMTHVARALEVDETDGFMKALVDTDSGRILGFACLGMEGGELMAVVQVAMAGGLTWRDLKNMTFAHPTLAESLNNLFSLVERA
jgi:pyruvate/2-oxoglutarate dehydrogenase complex dihydrolipoamide dehydrogenase (E3) component